MATIVAGIYLQFGKYKGSIDTTLEDFKAAQWHGEEEFDNRCRREATRRR